MADPVKALQQLKRRIARVEVERILTAFLPPIAVLIAAAATIQSVGAQTWGRWGYVLGPLAARDLRVALITAAAVTLLASGVIAYGAFRANGDPIRVAEIIDRKLGCHEEVLTLATLVSDQRRSRRSPLFPVLWQRAAHYLDGIDPVRTYPFAAKQPIRLAFLLITASTVLIALAIIAVLVVAGRSPMAAEARELRMAARELTRSSTDPQVAELADKLRTIADLLENPKVPAETKLQQLASIEQQLKNHQEQSAGSNKGQGGGGKGNQGSGSGTGNQGAGQGQGAGPGNGAGSGPGKANTGEPQLAEITKDLSKAQAKLEEESSGEKSPQRSDTSNQGAAKSPKPGENPQLAGAENLNPNDNANRLKPGHEPQPGQEKVQSGQTSENRKDFGSPKGDTHLGQFPQPGNFEKFYKAGEHGPGLAIQNARYVLFRIPQASQSSGGKSVIDNQRQQASVPYENLPLKAERIAAEPDESQLIPPRYRELLR